MNNPPEQTTQSRPTPGSVATKRTRYVMIAAAITLPENQGLKVDDLGRILGFAESLPQLQLFRSDVESMVSIHALKQTKTKAGVMTFFPGDVALATIPTDQHGGWRL